MSINSYKDQISANEKERINEIISNLKNNKTIHLISRKKTMLLLSLIGLAYFLFVLFGLFVFPVQRYDFRSWLLFIVFLFMFIQGVISFYSRDGELFLDSNGITVYYCFSNIHIDWFEIKKIEYTKFRIFKQLFLTLSGKRIKLTKFSYRGLSVLGLYHLIILMCREKNIEIEGSLF
jgi:hypothetical protein